MANKDIDPLPEHGDPFKRPAEQHTNKPTDPNTPKCHGCGSYHGSVNVEMNCMRGVLAKLRASLAEKVKTP